ncbi:helix-turn-helix domain-containing protein [Leadbettera azotonutricia]|uniref:Transcriptional regulator, AraC family n=1 Tax=Leadbettera azotonutricia (strain ATCC BAA-888 / DSM 13862 / ZAS-9) TaxID=545695 RepID=F5Y9K0_LEAAZ|nr:AraC family transcriptional regulator [Leadbettera azotonutricia]AEF81048.1 transcriptional regulator, AraC family [Leadbettera azotonutricia ZAS-9]
MKVHETGVLQASNIYFHTPSEANRNLFLVPSTCGHYFCTDSYQVARENYGNFLLLFVKNGKGFIYVKNRRVVLSKNDAFLLDCYHYHRYGTLAGASLEMVWVHFDGAMARRYFNAITQGANCAVLSPRNPQSLYSNLYSIYEQFHKNKAANDILNNRCIINILTEFLLDSSPIEDQKSILWTDLLAYIAENVQNSLKLKDLAERVSLSPYYFTRQFKKETGYTPHQYVLLARINTAKHFLKGSYLTIKEIAFACGFPSESGFCIAFKHATGTSPLVYRDSTVSDQTNLQE